MDVVYSCGAKRNLRNAQPINRSLQTYPKRGNFLIVRELPVEMREEVSGFRWVSTMKNELKTKPSNNSEPISC